MKNEFMERIVMDPTIMTGKPVIRSTRIPVDMLIRMVAQRISNEEILADYPSLQGKDIQAALFYAAATVAHERVYPLQLN